MLHVISNDFHLLICRFLTLIGLFRHRSPGLAQLRPTFLRHFVEQFATVLQFDQRCRDPFDQDAAHALIPPLARMNSPRGSESFLHCSANRNVRDHLLRVLGSTLPGSEVHRITTSNGSTRLGIGHP
jgi:hypothetical protein